MRNFHMKTFGCKVAQYDGDKLREYLIKNGIGENENAQFLIINGCAVTKRAESKARAFARKYRRNNVDTKIILYGCIAKKVKNFTSKEDKYWDYAITHEDYNGFRELFSNEIVQNDSEMGQQYKISQKRIRPFIKIHDGCNQFCDYCIVPHLRGRERSIAPETIIEEIQKYQDRQEIVLTGIHIGRYDYDGDNLANLLEKILHRTTINQIRLSSIEPNEFSEELLDIFSSNKRIARYLHIPLQSGSDRILKKMGRPYSSSDFIELINNIKKRNPETSIGTDVIIGYPEETNRDFEKSYLLLDKLPIYNIHQFGYSARPGTGSFDKHQAYTGEERKVRIEKINKLRQKKKHDFMKKYIHKKQNYLVEQYDGKYYYGTSSNYIQFLSDLPGLEIGKQYSLAGIKIIGDKLLCR
ncbi:MAG: MiaB/RimO family radical SAM methylthiotransferase [Candidatus Zixiibacteriota bacterium]